MTVQIFNEINYFKFKLEGYTTKTKEIKKKLILPNKWKTSTKSKVLSVEGSNSFGLIMGQQIMKNRYIIGLDVDDKIECVEGNYKVLNGVKAFNKLCKNHKYDPRDTLCERTRSGGYHYYFYVDEETLSTLPTAVCNLQISKTEKASIDIKVKDSFMICGGSNFKLDGHKYSYDWLSENVSVSEINELPSWLFDIIMSHRLLGNKNEAPKTDKMKKRNSEDSNDTTSHFKYDISDIQLTELLDMLSNEWRNNFHKWLKIATVCKSLNMYSIFDKWSKKSAKYDKILNKNMLIV